MLFDKICQMREIDRQPKLQSESGVVPGVLRIGVDLDGVIDTLFPAMRTRLLAYGVDIYQIINYRQENQLSIAYDLRDWPEITEAGFL